MPQDKVEVLVVGAGPVGLTMAGELARHGIICRIIDQLAAPSPYCRAIGITPRTLEVWDDMGIVQTMIDAGVWLRGRRSMVNGSKQDDSIADFSDLPYGPLGIPQPETERILTAHLATFGIAVERQVTLSSLKQQENGVEVELTHPDLSTERASFRYVVGCDGSRSAVRRQSGIAFEGDRFPMGFMLGDVRLDYDLPRGMSLWSVAPQEGSAPDFLVAIPLPERNRYRVSMLAPADGNDLQTGSEHGLEIDQPAPTLNELQAVANRLLPAAKMSDLRWSSNFHIGMRLAVRYREGAAFLAGDAAHVHPPTGGQGMNTGIQDAYNLAWKMGLVIRGSASAKLLDTYEAERRPVAADVIARTVAASQMLGQRRANATDERLADTQILVNYRGSVLSQDAVEGALGDLSIRAGDRAPDCLGLRRENVRSPFRLFDVTRGTDHVLLFYASTGIGQEQIELLERIAQRLKTSSLPPCRVFAIGSPECRMPEMIGISILSDSENEFATAYAPAIGTGYVIRPDGYIAYHARPLNEQDLVGYFTALA